MRAVLNDAISIYPDASPSERIRRALVRHLQSREAGGVFQVREDEPAPRIEAGLHRTP